MDQETDIHLDPDEEILTYIVSDEALEAAAGMERGNPSLASIMTRYCHCC
jgi:hypothetical protein